jgi:hypothetical protein
MASWSTSRSIVARSNVDAGYAVRRYQDDAMKGTVVLQLCGVVDEAVLVTEVGLDDAQVFVDLSGGGAVAEDVSSG